MVMYHSHADIIRAWPDVWAFADDLGVEFETAKKYRSRSSIPWYHWDVVVGSAKRRKIKGVTHDVLKTLSPVKRGRGRNKVMSLHVA